MKCCNRTLVLLPLVALLSGCALGAFAVAYDAVKAATGNCEVCPIPVSYPEGAHWVKEPMESNTRMTDWVKCGGNQNLQIAYPQWTSPTTYQEYDQGKKKYYQALQSCMQERGYVYIEKCDSQCLRP